jgi:hypothetical protein
MTQTRAIAGAEVRNGNELAAQFLSDNTFGSDVCFHKNYVGNNCLRQQIVDMPVELLIPAEMTPYSGLNSVQGGANISITAFRKTYRF